MRDSPRMLPAARPYAICLAFSVAGAIGIAYATVHGPWAFSDSTAYVVSAMNFARGKGLGLIQASGDFSPLLHYPPLYPLVLSAAAFFHLDVLGAARWLNVLLFGSLVWAVGRLAYRGTRSTWLSFLVQSILLSSPVLTYLYCGAMSEPLFILLTMLGLSVMAKALTSSDRSQFVLAGCAAGLASLTRYTGVALAAVGVAAVLVLGTGSTRQRVSNGLTYLLIAVAPLAAWTLGTGLIRGAPAVRSLALPLGSLWEASRPLRADVADTIWRLLPYSSRLPHPPYWLIHAVWITTLLGIVAIGIGAVMKTRRSASAQSEDRPSLGVLVALLASYVLVYMGFVSLAFLFTWPMPDINERMLSPVLIPAYLSGILAFPAAVGMRPRIRFLLVIPVALAVGAVLSTAPAAIWTLNALHVDGAGYTSVAWRDSETVEAVMALSPSVPLISNESAALLLLTGRPAYDIPQFLELPPRPMFTRFGSALASPEEQAFRQRGAALVVFDTAVSQLQGVDTEEASSRIAELTDGLVLLGRFADGAIYFYP